MVVVGVVENCSPSISNVYLTSLYYCIKSGYNLSPTSVSRHQSCSFIAKFWVIRISNFFFRGESTGCRLISTASILEWLRNLLLHPSQGSSTERWSRNTLRVVTARVFYVLRGSLTSPFIFNKFSGDGSTI